MTCQRIPHIVWDSFITKNVGFRLKILGFTEALNPLKFTACCCMCCIDKFKLSRIWILKIYCKEIQRKCMVFQDGCICPDSFVLLCIIFGTHSANLRTIDQHNAKTLWSCNATHMRGLTFFISHYFYLALMFMSDIDTKQLKESLLWYEFT